MAHRRRVRRVLLAATFAVVAACGASTPDDMAVTDDEPDRLSFVEQDSAAVVQTSTATRVAVVEAPATRTAATTAGLYSGPDQLYTRIAEVVEGGVVVTTGVRVGEGASAWLEVEHPSGSLWVRAGDLRPIDG